MRLYIRTDVKRLRHYVGDHQRAWGILLYSLAHAYNAQVHRSTNHTLFSHILSGNLPGPKAFGDALAFSSDTHYRRHTRLNKKNGTQKSTPCVRRQTEDFSHDRVDTNNGDRNVKEKISLPSGQLVFINKPPLVASSARDAHGTATLTFKKVRRKDIGPFPILTVTDHSLAID